MNVLVSLKNKVDAFCLKDDHKERLETEFPDYEFRFVDSYDEFKLELDWADAALVWFFPEKLFSNTKRLKALYTPAAGKDWVAIDPSGKVSTFFSSYHGYMIAESFLSMLLYRNNRLDLAVSNQGQGLWNRNAFGNRALLRNKSLLIIGYGNIGRICAAQCMALGISVSGTCRDLSKEANCNLRPIESLKDYIGEYDIVLNLLPGNEATRAFVSSDLINAMKKGAEFYNFGRGITVDERALTEALKNNHLSFAGLDVFENEPLDNKSDLWQLPNVLLTPHSSCCYNDYLHLFIDELKSKL